jgi:TfoX/Sxy family transcriptional regulator of competence genes
MGSSQRTADFLIEQIAEAGQVSARKMFGEYGVYCDGRMVALICDDRFFVKPTAAGRAYIGRAEEAAPFPGAKPWFVIAEERWDEADWLRDLIVRTTAELPLPKPKRAKPKRAKPKKAKPKKPNLKKPKPEKSRPPSKKKRRLRTPAR